MQIDNENNNINNNNKKQKGKKRNNKLSEEITNIENESKNEQQQQQNQITLCVECGFREVNKNTHKKNHWMISLQDLFKEMNPILQNNSYLYVNKPYRSKVEELHTIITNCITSLTTLKDKLNLGSTPQQRLIEAIDQYNVKNSQENLGNLIISIQKSVKVAENSDSKSFFELLDSNEDSVCSFSEADQILKDLEKILIETENKRSAFTLYVEIKDKPLDFNISEININNLYKEIEGATSIKIKESWCSDDLDPLCVQLSKALQNNQTAQSLEINLSKLELQDKGAEQIVKSIRFIKPLTQLSLNFSDCEISNGTAKCIAKLIEGNKSIKNMKLNLGNNNIKYEGIKALSMSIAANKSLDTFSLNLKNNKLGHEGAKQIMTGVGMNVSIKVLKIFLENNQLGNKGVEQIVGHLAKNNIAKNIELQLQYNSITNEGVVMLQQGWIQSSQANDIRINLSKNKIDDNGAHSLFQAIKDNEYTKTFSVYLNDNQIKNETQKDVLNQIESYLEIKKSKNPQKFNEAIIFSF